MRCLALLVLLGSAVCVRAQELPVCDLTGPPALAHVSDQVLVSFDGDDPLGMSLRTTFQWSTDLGIHWQPCTAAPASPTTNPAAALATPFVGAPFLWDTAADRIALGDELGADFRATVFADHGLYSEGAQQLPSDSLPIHFGDLDADGDSDLVTWSLFSGVTVWENDGVGGLTGATWIWSFNNPAAGDLDGDGDVDIVSASVWGLEFWRNDGAANFVSVGVIPGTSGAYGANLADVDGDGDLDLYAAAPSELAVWTNDGVGNFAPLGPQAPLAIQPPLDAADVDGDGDLDLLDQLTIFTNDGTGSFGSSGIALPTHGSRSVADADGDGDVDLFLAHDDGARVWLNDGLGGFVDSGQLLVSAGAGLVDAGDIDGDGDVDLAFGRYSESNLVWLNDGAGVFADAGVRLGYYCTTTLGLGDLDGDGDLEIFEGRHSAQSGIWFLDHLGEVQSTCEHPGLWIDNRPRVTLSSPAAGATVARDVDVGFAGASPRPDDVTSTFEWSRDGGATWAPVTPAAISPTANPDPLRPAPFAGAHHVWDTVADGVGLSAPENAQLRVRSLGALGEQGRLHDSGQSLPGAYVSDIALGDFDGDGDVDAALPDPAGGCELWSNDGSGVLAATGQRLGTAPTAKVDAGDLDGDGDLDLILARDDTVWWNDGAGAFTSATQPFAFPYSLLSLHTGDLDGDGDVDIAQARNDNSVVIWRNDGGGSFTDTGQRVGAPYGRGLGLGDLDGDGDLDFIHAGVSEPARLWRNDGTGFFADTGQTLGTSNVRDVALADVDGDGDVDALLVSSGPAQIWHNDGLGTFSNSGQVLATVYRAALDDLDGDGAPEAITAEWGVLGVRVWWNDGLGGFADSGQFLVAGDSYAFEFADLDGDGDRDLVLTDFRQNRIFWNGARVVTDEVALVVANGPVCSISVVPAGAGDVAVQIDAGSLGGGPLGLLLECSVDGGATFAPCTAAAGSPSPNPMPAAAQGVHDFLWDSVGDGIGRLAPASVLLRWTVDDGAFPQGGSCTETVEIANGCAGECGDCNRDGVAGALLDALVAAQIHLGLRTPSPAQTYCCDANGSGTVDVLDVLLVAQSTVGLPVAFSCR